MNPEWKDPEMVGAQLYECKQKFVLPARNTFEHVDANPFLLLQQELETSKITPNYIQGI
jgi:hypothetical protein